MVEVPARIPDHWEIKRLKFVAEINPETLPDDANSDYLFNYLDISSVDSDGRIVATEATSFGAAPSRARRIVRKGDTLLSTVRTYLTAIAHIAENVDDLIASTGFAVLRPAPSLDSRFFFRLIQSKPFVTNVVAYSEGVGYPAISPSTLATLPAWVPPLPEQRAIAAFLDRETAKIDSSLAKKERLIELLGEKRTSLISHAVTGGLDPSVPLKDTGIEWLGQIPARWQVKRLKFCLASIEQGWSPSCENRRAEPEEWGVLKVGCVNGTQFDPSEQKALPVEVQPIVELEIKPGDILVSRANTRELLGSAALVYDVRPRLLLCDKLYRLKVLPHAADSAYLVMLLGSKFARYQLERDATGTSGSMQNIGQDTVENLLVPVPPLDEQVRMRNQMARETVKTDALIAKIRDAIDKLREYRIALISAAVTGKIDVREAASESHL
jgi:type I restriction enzyme S subunit